MNNNYNIKIVAFILFQLIGFLFSNDNELVVKEFTQSGELDALIVNPDGLINILDIVLLANLILGAN